MHIIFVVLEVLGSALCYCIGIVRFLVCIFALNNLSVLVIFGPKIHGGSKGGRPQNVTFAYSGVSCILVFEKSLLKFSTVIQVKHLTINFYAHYVWLAPLNVFPHTPVHVLGLNWEVVLLHSIIKLWLDLPCTVNPFEAYFHILCGFNVKTIAH